MDANACYNISIVDPNENELTYDASPYSNSLQLHTLANDIELSQQFSSYFTNDIPLGFPTQVSSNARPTSPRPSLLLDTRSIGPEFMSNTQHDRVYNTPNHSPTPQLLNVNNGAVSLQAPLSYRNRDEQYSPSAIDSVLLSAHSPLSAHHSALDDPTQGASSPYNPPSDSWSDVTAEYVLVEQYDESQSAQGISPQSPYSPYMIPPATPSPVTPSNQLSPANYESVYPYTTGANMLSGSPTTPGLSATSSGFPSPSPRTGHPPLTPIYPPSSSLSFTHTNGSVAGTPYSADGKTLAPSPFIGGSNIGASPAPSQLSLDTNVVSSNSNSYGANAVTISGNNVATMAHARNLSVPIAVYSQMAAQQQRQGGMSSNPLSQSTPGTPVSGYVPAYVPMVPSGTPSHIRTQSLPASINMTILQASLPDPATLGPFIPQRQYSPHTSSDRRRYVEEVSLDAPISFNLRGANNAVQEGIPLKDALTSKFMRLVGRDDPMFVGRGPSISVRLMWEGYPPWSRQIPTRDFRSPPGPITRSKLAKNVAKSVKRFIDENSDSRRIDPHCDRRWQVGPDHITVDDLILVKLHHVSMGSWQANLRLSHAL